MSRNSEAGFTIVEIAIVMLIAGILIATSATLLRPYLQLAQNNTTQKKMDNIAQALAQFAQAYGRLPCPGDPNPGTEPYGSPRNSGSAGTNFLSTNCGASASSYNGILPFTALGLTEDQASDSYHRLFTYWVNPGMTKYDPTSSNYATQDTYIQDACLSPSWFDTKQTTILNRPKAHLCCPKKDTTFPEGKINDETGRAFQAFLKTRPGTITGGYNIASSRFTYTDKIGLEDNASFAAVTPVTYPAPVDRLIAFVLLSHGKNGDGALLKGKPTTTRLPVTAPSGARESANYDGDQFFVVAPYSTTADNNYYDDILLYKTNDQLVSMFGNTSCEGP